MSIRKWEALRLSCFFVDVFFVDIHTLPKTQKYLEKKRCGRSFAELRSTYVTTSVKYLPAVREKIR